MENKPLCPYCGPWNGHPDGVEMEEVYHVEHFSLINIWWRCPECGSTSPIASDIYPRCASQAHNEAYQDAIRRFQPMQKPLTLEEVLAIDDIGFPCFVEFREENGQTDIEPEILTNRYHHYGEQNIDCVTFRLSDINVTWRPWRTRPTDEERAAAKWEEETTNG